MMESVDEEIDFLLSSKNTRFSAAEIDLLEQIFLLACKKDKMTRRELNLLLQTINSSANIPADIHNMPDVDEPGIISLDLFVEKIKNLANPSPNDNLIIKDLIHRKYDPDRTGTISVDQWRELSSLSTNDEFDVSPFILHADRLDYNKLIDMITR